MLQANPTLTPNLVKAILQYTAQVYPGYNALTQGAGFLNTKGAVELARFFKTAQPGQRYPSSRTWSKKLLWGNHRISNGVIKPNATAWKLGVVWGAPTNVQGQNIVWGSYCAEECDNLVWGTTDSLTNVTWPGATASNLVWGTFHATPDPAKSPTTSCGARSADDGDNVVWGTDCDGADCDGVVWGTSRDDSRGSRQHRVGHHGGGQTTSCGAPTVRPTTSCGARRATTKTTSPGGTRARTRRCSTIRTSSR